MWSGDNGSDVWREWDPQGNPHAWLSARSLDPIGLGLAADCHLPGNEVILAKRDSSEARSRPWERPGRARRRWLGRARSLRISSIPPEAAAAAEEELRRLARS
ncbi:hypothetical protein NL676_039350 [Syzygium grande]|nr:hypothetical protein NL676_039350 [Syzygium grande]